MKSPCYKCPDRHLRCHSKCEKYQEFKSKNEERLDALKKSYSSEHDEHEFKILQYEKYKKRIGRKKK